MIDAEDDAALANGVRRIVEDERYRDALVQSASKRVMAEYNIRQTARKYVTLYRELVDQTVAS